MHRDLCGRLTREIPKTARGMVRGIGARGAHSAQGAVSAVTVRMGGRLAKSPCADVLSHVLRRSLPFVARLLAAERL